MQIHVTRRVESFLSGTGAYQAVQFDDAELLDREDPETVSLFRKVYETRSTRKDGRITVDLTPAEAVVLREYAESLEMVGRDNAWDADGRADMNAGAALLRQLDGLL